jgi:hypothetical protein
LTFLLILPLSNLFHSLCHVLLYSKTPKQVFFNQINIFDSFTHSISTHYSVPGYVLFFLVRQAPEYMLKLQNGKFDAPDRLFNGISDAWNSVNSNPADLKELIPEFYESNGEFLTNMLDLDMVSIQSDAVSKCSCNYR